MDFPAEPAPRSRVTDAQRAVDAGPRSAPSGAGAEPGGKPGLLATELRHHLPWTVAGVLVALTAVWTGLSLMTAFPVDNLFHIAHPTHLLLSAAATTAMAAVHRSGAARAVAIGIVGSAGVCTLSDVAMPYLGAMVLTDGARLHLHLCVAEHPMLVVVFVLLGIGVGLLGPKMVERSTIYGHAGHVVLSALASLLFLVESGVTLTVGILAPVLLLLVAAVMIPCCLSDIVVPVLFGGPRCPHTH